MSHSKTVQIRNSTAEFLIFSYQQGGDGINVRVEDGTIWLTNKSVSELFETSTENIRLHFKNIFQEGELLENSVTQKYLATATDGKNYHTKHYNLDAIIIET
ncbi:MAG: phosphoribosylaminoimidazolesuccinocarboxamide synthase [Defluviitaleaceae bacterium]|nr:phosphoribosylaminoimidazolesuccinocarboxamide synthase [Defluviitaleaceae bacterium]